METCLKLARTFDVNEAEKMLRAVSRGERGYPKLVYFRGVIKQMLELNIICLKKNCSFCRGILMSSSGIKF